MSKRRVKLILRSCLDKNVLAQHVLAQSLNKVDEHYLDECYLLVTLGVVAIIALLYSFIIYITVKAAEKQINNLVEWWNNRYNPYEKELNDYGEKLKVQNLLPYPHINGTVDELIDKHINSNLLPLTFVCVWAETLYVVVILGLALAWPRSAPWLGWFISIGVPAIALLPFCPRLHLIRGVKHQCHKVIRMIRNLIEIENEEQRGATDITPPVPIPTHALMRCK
jgi:hypothetical protein